MAGEWIYDKAKGLAPKFFPGEWDDAGEYWQGRCPAEDAHGTGRPAKTDCRVYFSYRDGPKGGGPGAYCQHKSCGAALAELNGKFREAIFARDGNSAGRPAAKPAEEGVVRQAPREREAWVPEFRISKLRGMVMAQSPVAWEWFEDRSPVAVRGLAPGDFLERVFLPGERVLVFTSFYSQGEFLWEVGRGGYRLGDKPGVKAVRSKLPRDGGKEGVWYLCQPVSGQWAANERRGGKESRRSEESVKRWRHVVLECDEEKTLRKRAFALDDAAKAADPDAAWAALVKGGGEKWATMAFQAGDWAEAAKKHHAEAAEVPGLWLRFLAMVPLAIVAIYSSGGHSLHALVRVDQPDKPTFDALLRENIKKTLPLLGADPGALTPVRLTRLPGCTRGGNEQRLIYLNPAANWAKPAAIATLPKAR